MNFGLQVLIRKLCVRDCVISQVSMKNYVQVCLEFFSAPFLVVFAGIYNTRTCLRVCSNKQKKTGFGL